MLSFSSKATSLSYSTIRKFSDLANTSDSISLGLGEPDFDTPAPIKEAAIQALESGLTHYAPSLGNLDLRKKIADYEPNYTENEVIVTAGSTEGLVSTLFTLLETHDEVILPLPAYPHYEPVIQLCGGKAIYYNSEPNDFQLHVETIESLLSPNTKAILINTPNNPTGVVYDTTTLQKLANLIMKYQLFLIVDSVYELLADTPISHDWVDSIKEQVIFCKSFSKPYGMTGWRLGYLLGPKDFIETCGKVHSYFTTAVNSFIQPAGLVALDTNPNIIQETFQKRRNFLYETCLNLDLKVVQPTGGFFIFPSIQEFQMSSEEFCLRLFEEEKLAVIPGSAFGVEGYIRISACLPIKRLEEAMTRFSRFIHHLRSKLIDTPPVSA